MKDHLFALFYWGTPVGALVCIVWWLFSRSEIAFSLALGFALAAFVLGIVEKLKNEK